MRMQLRDKLTLTGEPERYTTGETTDRFEVVADTRQEAEAIRAALANIALLALQSEVALDPEDARVLLDFMRASQRQQARLTVDIEQADRLARLIQQGAPSAMPEILHNQFTPHRNKDISVTDDELLTRTATSIGEEINIEVNTRKFRKELDEEL